MKGHEEEDISNFIDIQVVTVDMSYTEVSFDRVNTCLLDTLELLICYTYGTEYSNLADLCDESILHQVEGALGVCFTDLSVFLLQSEIS